MNSADMHKSIKSDLGMELSGHHIAACFKSVTPGGGTELLFCHASAGDPEVQHKLDSIDGRKELMKQPRISPFRDCWEVTGPDGG
jgi:hypothetical protein